MGCNGGGEGRGGRGEGADGASLRGGQSESDRCGSLRGGRKEVAAGTSLVAATTHGCSAAEATGGRDASRGGWRGGPRRGLRRGYEKGQGQDDVPWKRRRNFEHNEQERRRGITMRTPLVSCLLPGSWIWITRTVDRAPWSSWSKVREGDIIYSLYHHQHRPTATAGHTPEPRPSTRLPASTCASI
jgi:hypothetical protein